MKILSAILLACSSVAWAADPYDRFENAMAEVRQTTNGEKPECDGILEPEKDSSAAESPSEEPPVVESVAENAAETFTQAPVTETPAAESPEAAPAPRVPIGPSLDNISSISARKENWMETVKTIYAKVEKLEPGQTLAIRDTEEVLKLEHWSQLLKSMGLRILGLRSFNGLNKIQVLAQKVTPEQGVEIQPVDWIHLDTPANFAVQTFKNRENGTVREMLYRTQRRILTFPYYVNDGKLTVLVAPETAGIPVTSELNEVSGTGYFPHPISIELEKRDNAERKAARFLKKLMPMQFGFRVQKTAGFFYPSPDSILEGATSLFVPLKKPVTEKVSDWEPVEAGSLLERAHWTTGGNGLLETNLYFLFLKSKQKLPPWSGEPVQLEDHRQEQVPPARLLEIYKAKHWRRRTWFLPSQPRQWMLGRLEYREVNTAGIRIRQSSMEYARLKNQSQHSVSLLPVKRINGRIWVGLTQTDSPSPQAHKETSVMWSLPVLRMPVSESSLQTGLDRLKNEFQQRNSAEIVSAQSLGASYRTEGELSSDIIHPFLVEIKDETQTRLKFFPLGLLVREAHELRDQRLLISLFRLAHAEGNLR